MVQEMPERHGFFVISFVRPLHSWASWQTSPRASGALPQVIIFKVNFTIVVGRGRDFVDSADPLSKKHSHCPEVLCTHYANQI